MKQFKLEINLDAYGEATAFIEKYKTLKGRALAHRLGLKGKGSENLASAFSHYAWNKHTAKELRDTGEIAKAMKYEKIADIIYNRDIAPICECW